MENKHLIGKTSISIYDNNKLLNITFKQNFI